ncbi:MAG: helix-turn-helix transcriptional regulator [Lachnospiraceae bacterium]|nr:helix-turn-helix transcriptional regulator [Lachnospiraceae bacterium]
MSENTSDFNTSLDSIQDLGSIISSNLKRLISKNGITQKDLADKLGVAPASMTDYCKGRRIPNVEFFVSLKNLYDISIDDFLTKSINPSSRSLPAKESSFVTNVMTTYHKYCGIYFVYYFDTGKYKGRDTQPPKDSVHFGVLFIYENPSSLDVPEFSCAAVLGIKEREDVTILKKTLEDLSDPSRIIDYIGNKYPNTAYFGDFELSNEHAFVTMSHASTDKALLIFHRVDNNKPNYTGGIGTINSVSKGRERAPVVQFIGISRYPLSMSIEEIHHSLLLNYPNFQAESETEDMISNFKALYLDSEVAKQGFSEYQKSIIVRSTLERYIKKSLERNMFRYGKVSERDDDEWYHAIKVASKNDNN